MSRFVRHLLCTAVAGAMLAASAGAQLLPSVSLPPVSLPAPVGQCAGGRARRTGRARPAAGAARNPADARLGRRPAREHRRIGRADLARAAGACACRSWCGRTARSSRADNAGQPVRRGVLVAVDPDPLSLQLAARAGFRIVADDRDPALGIHVVQMAVPGSMNARAGAQAVAARGAAAAGRFRPSLRACRRRAFADARGARVICRNREWTRCRNDRRRSRLASVARRRSHRAERFRRVAAAHRTRHRRRFAAGR